MDSCLWKTAQENEDNQNGWEYSHSAFRHYHAQPLLFTPKRNVNRKRIQDDSLGFNPDQVVNLNYFKYSLRKRPDFSPKNQTSAQKKREKNDNCSLESSYKEISKAKEASREVESVKSFPNRTKKDSSSPVRTRRSRKRYKRKKLAMTTTKKSLETLVCDYFKSIDYSSIKKGSPEYHQISKNFALPLEEVLKIQEDLHTYVEEREDSEILVDLKNIETKKFSFFFNKEEPKVDFKTEYDPKKHEEEQNRKEIREIGCLIFLMKKHFGLNCSIQEIRKLLERNRGFKVVKRMIEFQNHRIKKTVEDFRGKSQTKS